MARRLLPDDVWQLIESLLPKHPMRPKGGRPLIDDRDVLTGILFMLKTGIAWEDLPHEMGCGCGMTCLRRLREWQQQGVWPKIREVLETHLPEAKRIDWSRAEGRGSLGREENGELAEHDMPVEPVPQDTQAISTAAQQGQLESVRSMTTFVQ
jgi:transposase